MTHPSDDDRLVEFLRQHRPAPPPAAPNLEIQILASIDAGSKLPVPHRRSRPRQWLATSALAASALIVLGGWVGWRTRWQPDTTMATVDEFLTETWYGSVYGDDTTRLALDTAQPDWIFSVYATPY